MSNPLIPPLLNDEPGDVPTKDVDGEQVLDQDIDDALVDSADADRVAASAEDEDLDNV